MIPKTTIRAFVALPIPDAVAAFIRQIQGRLQFPDASVRWVPTPNIHLTLKFLGDIDISRVSAIAAQMDGVVGSTPSLSLTARGVGVFPDLRRARVLWVGLAGDLERLGVLQASLESGLESIGFNRDARAFRAHLTIGRTRQRIEPQRLGAGLEPLKTVESESFRVDRLGLYQSVLKPSGAEHTLLHKATLAPFDAAADVR